MKSKVWCGNNIAVLKQFADNTFDSIVTDPPYGIDFLGKAWDANTGALETYQQCLRVLKPGGHIIAFSAARTYHHLAVTIEQAGFEIRDQIMWIYGSGFPKSQDIGKQIERREGKRTAKSPGQLYENIENGTGENNTTCKTCGKNNVLIGSRFNCDKEICDMRERLKPADNEWSGWGTALKPAHEPMVLARKPISEKNIADNCLKHGTGALNIDATRVELGVGDPTPEEWKKGWDRTAGGAGEYSKLAGDVKHGTEAGGKDISDYAKSGRFPANIIHDGSDEVVADFPQDSQRFFYCPKVSRKERHIGHEEALKEHGRISPKQMYGSVDEDGIKEDMHKQGEIPVGLNNHPTVKPIELMKYLIKLVTKPGGRVLDPFNGSGSTGCAAVEMDYDYTGIDLDPDYVAISEKRIQAWYDATHQPINVLFKEEE